MIKPEQVPNEVFAAFQQAWADPSTLSTKECIAAALNAWPGMTHNPAIEQYGVMQRPYLILPLPQEPSDE